VIQSGEDEEEAVHLGFLDSPSKRKAICLDDSVCSKLGKCIAQSPKLFLKRIWEVVDCRFPTALVCLGGECKERTFGKDLLSHDNLASSSKAKSLSFDIENGPWNGDFGTRTSATT
jgi:hypothetical protein